MIDGIVLMVCGALCMPSIIAKQKPEAKELLGKIAAFQGWIGILVFAWGIWGIISAILTLSWLGSTPLWWITNLAGNVLNVGVGFLLGFGLIQQFVLSKASPEAKTKAEELHQKLAGMQIPLGFACLIGGIWVILYNIVLWNIFRI